MYRDDDEEFDALTAEELEQMEADEEFRRRVRREIQRVQSGEAEEDIRRDEEEAEAEREAEREAEERHRRRRSNLFWQIFSGNILLNHSLRSNYRYFAAIAVMCFVSIMVMFMVLYADIRYSQAERELRLVRERSIRLQEELYERTSYDAVRQDLEQRGIIMQDPRKAK